MVDTYDIILIRLDGCGLKVRQKEHVQSCPSQNIHLTNAIAMQRSFLYSILETSWGFRAVADPGGFLFVVLRACVAGLVRAHEHSRKRSGQRNPPPPPPLSKS